MRESKVISGKEAACLIRDGSTLAVMGSGGGVAEPTHLVRCLGKRFAGEGHPRNLLLYHANGIGNYKDMGVDPLAMEGLVRRVIGGHWGMSPAMCRLATENKIEAYNFPQGVLSQMYAAIAGNKPGVITKIGLNTFVDPRIEGGRLNAVTPPDHVRLLELDGEEWLYFPTLKLDACFIRGTAADEKGNITMEEEAAFLDALSMAQAARNSGGVVIAQVKYLAQKGTLDPKQIKVPGIYVDYIVLCPGQPQTAESVYDPSLAGRVKAPLETIPPLPLDYPKVIARRAAMELFPGAVVNLGVGIPSGVASVASEEGLLDSVTFTVEQGVIGGVPSGGVIFGTAHNPEVIIGQTDQFNFYDGGGLDITFLGMAEADAMGNVNASKTGGLLAGCGGFINISQNTKKVVFCSAFTAKGLKTSVANGRLSIAEEGKIIKFIKAVNQITFSGRNAAIGGQEVLFVTERAVFQLTAKGLRLKEIAPGVDLEKDILRLMEFKPVIDGNLQTMDENLFQ